MFGPLLDVQMSFLVAGARDCAPCQKWAKREGFVAFPKNDDRRGIFQEDLQRCIFRGGRNTRDMFISVRRRWFPKRGCILEHQIFSFGKMILRTGAALRMAMASIFCGRRSTLDRWSGKITKTHWYEAISSALNFELFKEVSQNSFVFKLADRQIDR